jgi:hypothetical protein
MSLTPREDPARPFLVVEGRVFPPSAYRPSTFMDLEDTPAWWWALAALGVLLLLAGVLVGAQRGEAVAIGGVALFLATAVLAGAERVEIATAFGAAGIIWTAAGISVVLGTDPSAVGSLVGFGVCGATLVAVGALGVVRARRARGSSE